MPQKDIWSKCEQAFMLILAPALFLLCCFIFSRNLFMVFGASDTAWLIKTGQVIVEHGLPRLDPFSYTCPDRPIVIYQWLFTVFAFLAYKLGGLWLVGLATAILLAITYLWLLPSMMLGQGVRAVYVFGLLCMTSMPAWYWARPQVVSFLLITVFAFILERFRHKGYERRLWALPLLMVLWANLHSFWFVGLFMVSAYMIPAGLKAAGPERRRLALILSFSFLAVLLNPYGIGLVQYNLSFLTEPDFSTIGELQPHLFLYPYSNRAPLIYLALAWLAIICGRKNLPKTPLLLGLIFTIVGLKHYRFVPVSILLTWPYLGLALSKFHFSSTEGSVSSFKRVFEKSLPALALCLTSFAFVNRFAPGKPVWFMHANSNQGAIAFLKQHPELNSRLFCDSAIGCSLILEDMGPVFIDNRFDFYGKKFCDDFTACVGATGDWQAYLARWGIKSVVIDDDRTLFGELIKSSWLYVFDDGNCSIWLKDDLEGRALYTRLKMAVSDKPSEPRMAMGSQAAASGSRRPLTTSAMQTSCSMKKPSTTTPP